MQEMLFSGEADVTSMDEMYLYRFYITQIIDRIRD